MMTQSKKSVASVPDTTRSREIWYTYIYEKGHKQMSDWSDRMEAERLRRIRRLIG